MINCPVSNFTCKLITKNNRNSNNDRFFNYNYLIKNYIGGKIFWTGVSLIEYNKNPDNYIILSESEYNGKKYLILQINPKKNVCSN